MRIKLRNFRQHDDRTLDLPDTGLYLLDGPSGSGKTSFLDGVLEALRGEADDIVSWGGGQSCETDVTILLPEPIRIVRTRGPHTLVVTYEGAEYHDDAAQGIIDRLFGTTHEFLASSYIQQGMSGSLLTLGPADQLRFIQQLGCGKTDPEVIRQQISELIKKREADVSVADAACQSAQSVLWRNKQTIESHEADTVEPAPIYDPNDMDEEAARDATLADDLIRLTNQLAEINKKIDNPVYGLIDSMDRERAQSGRLIQQLNADIVDIDGQLAGKPEPWATTKEQDCAARLIDLDKKQSRFKALAAIDQLRDQVRTEYPESIEQTSLADFLQARRSLLDDKVTELAPHYQFANDRVRELNALKEPQACPECGAALAVQAGKIIHERAVPTNLAELRITAANRVLHCATQLKQLSDEGKRIGDVLANVKALRANVPTDTVPELTTPELVEAERIRIVTYMESQRQAQLERHVLLGRRRDAVAQIEQRARAIRDAEAQIARAVDGGLEPVEKLRSDRLAVSVKIEWTQKQRAGLVQVMIARSQYQSEMAAYRAKQQIVTKMRADHEQAEQNHQARTAALELAHALVLAARRARELADFAAVEAIESVIDSINQNAKQVIDRFFPDDGTSVKICNTSQTKKGDLRPKLHVEVFHKGKLAKRMKSLSGGERSRIYLAFQLALSEMYKSPILLIDEGFTGLELDKKVECIEVLKEVAREKLVLVVEHGVPGALFDEVFRM